MKCVMTGVAGFIGSNLCEALLDKGDSVVGIDSFTDYYPREMKDSNIKHLLKSKDFKLVRADLAEAPLEKVLQGAECVIHLAAQPGVRESWGRSFSYYVRDNVVGMQKLLEAAASSRVGRLVFSSSSSIYGDAERMPTPEDVTPRPVSPYGATKLLGEHLCEVYRKNRGLSTVVLRYFTVYGPRQRPDMAFYRFIDAVSKGRKIRVFGNGRQKRDFTYVSDVVSATMMALDAEPGSIFNVGAGSSHRLSDAIDMIAKAVGQEPVILFEEESAGDVRDTSADNSLIRRELGWSPKVELRDGLGNQVLWQLGKGSG